VEVGGGKISGENIMPVVKNMMGKDLNGERQARDHHSISNIIKSSDLKMQRTHYVIERSIIN